MNIYHSSDADSKKHRSRSSKINNIVDIDKIETD